MNIAWLTKLLAPIASLKLTVVLFVLSMFLIFAGTLAQAEQGTWEAMDRYFRSFLVWIEFRLFAPAETVDDFGAFPFPGGFVLIGLLLVNLIAAHTLRFKFTRKRLGILMTHFGLILLLGSELVTAALAEEGSMTIDEGSYSNYVEHTRDYELAVLDTSPNEHDNVTVVPDALLRRSLTNGRINHPDLPFAIEVHEWMANSELVDLDQATDEAQQANPATHGLGTRAIALPRPTAAGTDDEQEIDSPAAYVALYHKSQTLGTYLVTPWTNQLQPVEVDGQNYEIALRFRRTYRPYTLHLEEFNHDRFTGTDTPRNFSSRVRLVDPRHNEDREVLISMNNPLRYDGETFYQASYQPGDTGTVLQVVRNPAWLLPYLSCVLVGVGLTMHFLMHLAGFLRRRQR